MELLAILLHAKNAGQQYNQCIPRESSIVVAFSQCHDLRLGNRRLWELSSSRKGYALTLCDLPEDRT